MEKSGTFRRAKVLFMTTDQFQMIRMATLQGADVIIVDETTVAKDRFGLMQSFKIEEIKHYIKSTEAVCAESNQLTFPQMLQIGDTCRKCNHVVKERALVLTTFVGCMC
jgi:hypothetical protein